MYVTVDGRAFRGQWDCADGQGVCRATTWAPAKRGEGARGKGKYREPRMAGAYCLVGESSFAHIMAASLGLASGNCQESHGISVGCARVIIAELFPLADFLSRPSWHRCRKCIRLGNYGKSFRVRARGSWAGVRSSRMSAKSSESFASVHTDTCSDEWGSEASGERGLRSPERRPRVLHQGKW